MPAAARPSGPEQYYSPSAPPGEGRDRAGALTRSERPSVSNPLCPETAHRHVSDEVGQSPKTDTIGSRTDDRFGEIHASMRNEL